MTVCAQSCLTLYDPIDQPIRLLCLWNFPGKNIGVGCHFLLKRIFLTQGLNPCLLHWQMGSLLLHYLGSPRHTAIQYFSNFFNKMAGKNYSSSKHRLFYVLHSKNPLKFLNLLFLSSFFKFYFFSLFSLQTPASRADFKQITERKLLCSAIKLKYFRSNTLVIYPNIIQMCKNFKIYFE